MPISSRSPHDVDADNVRFLDYQPRELCRIALERGRPLRRPRARASGFVVPSRLNGILLRARPGDRGGGRGQRDSPGRSQRRLPASSFGRGGRTCVAEEIRKAATGSHDLAEMGRRAGRKWVDSEAGAWSAQSSGTDGLLADVLGRR